MKVKVCIPSPQAVFSTSTVFYLSQGDNKSWMRSVCFLPL